MTAALLIATLCLGAVAPLTEAQRTALATAYDGRDHREEAFAALVENALAWTQGWGDEPVRMQVDPAALLADPEAHRGQLCLIQGVLQQRSRLPRPHQGVWEWFVRDDEGNPLLVFVVGLEGDGGMNEGQRIAVPARFYKRVNAVARDGTEHEYAAFVGALPRDESARATSPLAVMGAVVAVLAGVFLVLLIGVKRARGRVMARRSGARGLEAPVDGQAPLPDDPAAALAELKRRAEAAGR